MGIPGASDDVALRAAAEGFRHLDHRLQVTGEVDGVTFVDDSLSTNVLPTLAALDAFPGRRVALIVGGHDRGIDYAPLAAGLRDRPDPTLVLTLPDSGHRIHAEIESALASTSAAGATGARAAPSPATGAATLAGVGAVSSAGGPSGLADVVDCDGLESAVARGFAWARPDGVVLLSPAAPSFGQFRDYRDRGEAFTRAMHACQPA